VNEPSEPPPEDSLDSLSRRLLLGIGVATAASGALQIVAPGRLLRSLSANDDATSRALFRMLGMFMVVTSGTLVQALLSPVRQPIVMLWASVTKLGAAAIMANNVRRGVFSKLALPVAAADLLAAVLAALRWSRLRGS